MPRLDVVEESVEDLILGRVGIDVSHHGLETRQQVHQELIDQLRDELPEIRDRAEQTQDAQRQEAQEIALLRERLAVVESRDATRQLRIEHLEEMIVLMDREIHRLRGRPGGSGAPGVSGAPDGAPGGA